MAYSYSRVFRTDPFDTKKDLYKYNLEHGTFVPGPRTSVEDLNDKFTVEAVREEIVKRTKKVDGSPDIAPAAEHVREMFASVCDQLVELGGQNA